MSKKTMIIVIVLAVVLILFVIMQKPKTTTNVNPTQAPTTPTNPFAQIGAAIGSIIGAKTS